MRPNASFFNILNGYEYVYRNIFLTLKEGSRTIRHEVALIKKCILDSRKYCG